MKNGEWLRRAGPFEVSENTLSEVEGRIDLWRNAAVVSQEEVLELTERLQESDEIIEQLRTVFASGSMVREEHS
jgi:transposase-like protein